MTLLRNGKVRYSELESRILEAIPDNGEPIDTVTLADRVYAADERPRHARQSVLSSANYLIAKVNDNQEAWQIFKSEHIKPTLFWRGDRIDWLAPAPAPVITVEAAEVAPSEPEIVETVAEETAAPAETVPAIRPARSLGEARMMAKTVIRLQRRLGKQVAEANRTLAVITQLSAAMSAAGAEGLVSGQSRPPH